MTEHGEARVVRLEMVTPFDSSLAALEQAEQLVKLKGCVLCQITRDVDRGSTRSKEEWRSCRAELGVPVKVYSQDQAPAAVLEAIGHAPPAVCAVTENGEVRQLLDERALARCRGSVQDFRGRLIYRIAALGLRI